MAAPHVSGAAALMVATRRERSLVNPAVMGDLTTSDLRQRVLNCVDLIPALSGNVATGGRLNLYCGINQQGIGWGDVHFVTFDGRNYDLQSFGEFIMAETARMDDDWVVQTRQEPWVSNNSVSVNTAFATLVDGQRVVFDLDFSNRLQIDGVNVSLADGGTLSVGNSQIERIANKYIITYAGDDGIVDSADAKLTALDQGNHINITISNFGTMQGLLGNNDGNPENDFALRDGTQLPSNLTVAEIHGEYADSWRVQEGESLFDNSEVVIGNPEKFISLDDFDPEEVADARNKALEAGIPDGEILDAVTLDLVVTGDDNFLEGAVELFVEETDTDTAPDLIVNSFEITGEAFISGDSLKLPIEVVVQNQGNAPADLFKVDVQYTQQGNPPFLVAFTADDTSEVNPDNLVYPYTRNPLEAGDEVTFTGELTFDDSLAGEEIALVATADSTAGDELIPEFGRVEESNENNNSSEISEVTLDITDDDAEPDPEPEPPEDQIISGDSGENTLKGGGGDDIIRGNSGDDNLNGGLGEDTVVGGIGSDIVNGGYGNDRLFGSSGDDILLGRLGSDVLLGGSGNDTLEGGQGRDRLNGGPGNDVLTGGGSIDRFIFATNEPFQTQDVGIDEITDFSVQQDIIILDLTTFTAISSQSGTGFSIAGEFATVTNDQDAATSDAVIVYNSSNGNLFYNPNGSNPGFGSGSQFATLTNTPSLEVEDFLLRS
ncbi:MAG: hypothetical protein F6K48_10855 [Okeania sp. SIO3H1]|nr:hypothetical protein [Okeania sp. SIO3H1]